MTMTRTQATESASGDATASALLSHPLKDATPVMRARKRPLPPALLIPAALVATATLAPAAYLLLRQGFNLELLWSELNTPSTWPLIRNTIMLLIGVCTLTGFLGVSLAVLVARTSLPFEIGRAHV